MMGEATISTQMTRLNCEKLKNLWWCWLIMANIEDDWRKNSEILLCIFVWIKYYYALKYDKKDLPTDLFCLNKILLFIEIW